MVTGAIQIKPKAAVLAAVAFLCLSPGIASSADTTLNHPVLTYGKSNTLAGQSGVSGMLDPSKLHPGTPMVLDPATGAFEFELGGNKTRKLQLQLSQPIMLEMGQHLFSPEPGSNLLGLDATLQIPVGNGLSLHGGAEQLHGSSQFQALGSIQCQNGILGPDSYTASGCHFVTDTTSIFDRQTLNVGASQELGKVSTSVNWFTTQMTNGAGVYSLNQVNAATLLEKHLLKPFAADAALPGTSSTTFNAIGTTGVDLNFQLGFTTDQAGEIRLGLALTRVLEANYQSIYNSSLGPLEWTVAKPFDSAALGIEWSHGPFSSGIRGYYREPVSFLNRENLDSLSTFDVHFTWRAPWNANLSIGASNILGAGVDDRNNIEKSTDRFESIYGRIPYVRYQQDL